VLLIRQFFVEDIQKETELNALEAAWKKAVLLHVTLWARPYTREELW
jgi:hypothetical protein